MNDIDLLPKWMMRRYLVLRKEIGLKQVSFEDINKVLHKFFKDSDKVVRIFLSEARKIGWVVVDFDPQDNRMRLYQLKKSEDMFEKIVQEVYATNKAKK